jgi:hypothetical protein
MIRASNECDFDLCFPDVMYRGDILAQYKNMFDIAHIDGNRSGRDFFYPLYFPRHQWKSSIRQR